MTFLMLAALVDDHKGPVVCNVPDIGLVEVVKSDLLVMLRHHGDRNAQTKLVPLYKDGELILR